MANYCYNWAKISGSETALKTMLDNISKATNQNTESLWYETYPITLGLDRAEAPKDINTFYNDVYEEYGSKWFNIHIDDQTYENGQGTVLLGGDSAWSPMSPLFRKLSEVYQLEIESVFEESGNDFGGYYDCKNGVVTKDLTFEWRVFQYIDDRDTYINSMFDDLDCGHWEDLEDFKDVHKSEVFQFTTEEWADIYDYFNKQNNTK